MTDAPDHDAGGIGAQVPRFRRGVRLRFDETRACWILLAPERAFMPDEIGAEILQLVDGTRTVREIAQTLARRFAAPLDVVLADVSTVLADLAARGAMEA